ncbi:MAG TPA: FecR family protein [Bryobacteraceae bacterium]|nr:FecR family protein [Bryobacteraceae bacterium]
MRRLIVFLLPAALFAAQARYARLGEFQGDVEVQLQAADPWIPAERNLPLPEATWVRTAAESRLEIELDEGSVCRLGADSQIEISDYTRLSTGQRVTLLSLDHGTAWLTGQAEGKDVLMLVVPGAQVTFERGARIRLEAGDTASQISVLQGSVRFSSPAAELELREGQTARVEPANPTRFFLDREITAVDLDKWSLERDKALVAATSGLHVGQRFGAQDLDSAGTWIQTEDLGAVWKPKSQDDWKPFEKGRWRWYDTLGYTWVSDDAWGWLPYHYGRWTHRENLGWVWAPANSSIFKPGDVFWMRGNSKAPTLVGWGPLAPGEIWNPPDPDKGNPLQFQNAWLTFANFQENTTVIDPAGYSWQSFMPSPGNGPIVVSAPPEPLTVADFVQALPSPMFLWSRLEAMRPELRVGSTRVTPNLDGITYEKRSTRPVIVINPAPQPPVVVVTQAPAPPPETVEVPFPVPVYTGLVTLGPPKPASSPAAKAAPPATTPKSTLPPKGTPPQKSTNPADGRRQHDKQFRKPGEYEAASAAIQDIEGHRFGKALKELDSWTEKYAESDFKADRLYYYVLAYNGSGQPGKVVDTALQLLSSGIEKTLQDQRQMILALFLTTVNIEKVPYPSHEQFLTGQAAARDLLELVPGYFTSANRPAGTSEADWNKAQSDLEATAKTTLASLARRQRNLAR